jgi:hypothetical protein
MGGDGDCSFVACGRAPAAIFGWPASPSLIEVGLGLLAESGTVWVGGLDGPELSVGVPEGVKLLITDITSKVSSDGVDAGLHVARFESWFSGAIEDTAELFDECRLTKPDDAATGNVSLLLICDCEFAWPAPEQWGLLACSVGFGDISSACMVDP